MKKIGIFLAFSPKISLKNQGIGRLLGFILEGLSSQNIKIIIATPLWHKKMIVEFLQEQHIEISKIEWLTTEGIPYWLRINSFFSKTHHSLKKSRKNSHFLSRLIQDCKSMGVNVLTRWLSFSSTSLFICMGIVLFLASLVLAPFVILIFLFLIIHNLFKKISLWLLTSFSLLQKHLLTEKTQKFASKLKQIILILKHHSLHQAQGLIRDLHEKLRLKEILKLTQLINHRKDIPLWFAPTSFWPEIKFIRTKKIIAVPDIVFVDFPTRFLEHYTLSTLNKIQQTIETADHVICYSNEVKQNHLIQSVGMKSHKISVIPHGNIDLSNHFNETNTVAQKLLCAYQEETLQNNPYFRKHDIARIRYIFYSSQIRPHKNFLNFIKAYKTLLRERFLNIKLITTCDFQQDSQVAEYLIHHRLQHDVIALHEVPTPVLAALNQLAICAINPTLFEGGFPFTFSEAYSVGTPSVMSAIPVVLNEIKDENLQKIMLFDPYDIEDMANKIEWGVNNREKLYQLQKPLYQQFENRTWKKVAAEYMEVFNNVIHQNSNG